MFLPSLSGVDTALISFPIIQQNMSKNFPSDYRIPQIEGNFWDMFYVRLCTERKKEARKNERILYR